MEEGTNVHWCRGSRVKSIRDRSDIISRSSNVLLECARGIIAADFLVEAHAVVAAETGRATSTDGTDPFDAYALADADVGAFGARAHGDDCADAFVAADLAFLCWVREGFPAVGHDAEIAVADTAVGAGVLALVCGCGRLLGFRYTHSLMRTSPGPGLGVSSSTTLVETWPGLS